MKASDFEIEKAIQVGGEQGGVNAESLFRWVIYTNILKLFVDNLPIQESKDYELLKQFLLKNSGYINIRDYEIKSLVERHGFDVAVEQFKRFLSVKYNKNLEVKSERAPYFKLIPHLEDVLIRVLTSGSERENKNSYVVFFDDLDVWFSSSNESSVDSLIGLIRACRHVNNEIFGKNSISSKAVVLLRDDIEQHLSSRYADTAKIFASYSSRINWYQETFSGQDKEDFLNIKKFINKRIVVAFEKAQIACDKNDPWSSLVRSDVPGKSSFKYVIDQTLFRPRDLLLFFKPLETGQFSVPLSRDDIHALVGIYSDELAREVKNELSSFFHQIRLRMYFLL